MRVAILSLLLTLGAIIAPCTAQSIPDKAVLVFDVRMDMLKTSPLGKQMKFEEMLSQAQKRPGQGEADPSKLLRLFGAVSAPESMEALQVMRPDKGVPFEFFMRAKYQDSESASVAFQDALGEDNEKIERDGQTYYKADKGGAMPPGTFLHQVDDTTVEMATEAYAFRGDQNVFTDNLKTAWGKAPNEAIRMAIDIKGAQSLVAELIEEGKKSASDPTFEAYYDLIDNISNMGVSIDLTGKNLLSLRATALDVAQGEELKGGLDSLLFIAQAGGKQVLPMIGEFVPSAKPVAGAILDSLVAKIDGAEVSVVIPKPHGFEKAIQESSQIIPMLMGGGGPPPGAMGGPGPRGSDSKGSDSKGSIPVCCSEPALHQK